MKPAGYRAKFSLGLHVIHFRNHAKPSALTQSAQVVGLDDNAPGNASTFTWGWLAEGLAGPNYGSSITPGIGNEVLIDFIENDINRPLIVGSLYSEQDPSPYRTGEDASSELQLMAIADQC